MNDIEFLIATINNFFNLPIVKNIILILKIIFLSVSALLLFAIIYFLLHTKWFNFRFLEIFFEFFKYRPLASKRITKQWRRIKNLLESGLESNYKLAIIEADSILEEILKKLGYPGATLGEILEKINEDILPNIEDVKKAHQVRNNIVHDPDYKIDLKETESVISIYEKSFIDLGVL